MAKVPANFNGVLNKKGAVKKYLINFLVIFIAGFIFGYIAETLYFYNLSGGSNGFWLIFRPF